ncbi:phage tail family protein [Bacillus thuringiensis]|nr:phage tail family protein [Bacillus thuringiensis]MED2829715.1 phage tail family protein [Bacillus thuringiensis]MED2856334.1 phage tail family protein [Bacillus thuringiensis]MED2863862.1 phage tail family protein [Bacillus thuringiensis]
MAFIYRGQHASRYMLVNTIQRDLLPQKTANLLKASGKIGAYDFGSETDVMRYTVVATITAATELERETKLDAIRTWLNKDDGELIFDFKNHVSYTAKIDGQTPITPIGTSCMIQFTLLCSDPVGDGLTKEYEIKHGNMKTEVVNEGTTEAYPNVKVKFTEDTPIVSIIGKDYAVTAGVAPDYQKNTVPYEERVLYDELIDPRQWRDASDIYNGIVYGTFESNGYLFHQKGWDYGKAKEGTTDPKFNGWHGASMYRNIPEPIDNFMVELHSTFRSWDRQDMGRVGFYLLDQNGRKFGNAHLNDVTWMKTQQIATVKFGDDNNGIGMVYDRGGFDGVWSGWNNGIIRFGRKERKGYVTWFTYFAIIDDKTGRYHTELYREYADYTGRYLNKLAGVQLETSMLGNGDKRYYMTLNHVNVFKYNENQRDKVNDMVFKRGDTLEVDMGSASIYKNGLLANELLDPSSDFFSIPTGRSELAIFPATAGETNITFTNKYL